MFDLKKKLFCIFLAYIVTFSRDAYCTVLLQIIRKIRVSCNGISKLYFLLVSDNSPLPLTPDYGGSVVRYADGVFDPHFSRYITIMEGE
jgi:hypothetical protein